MSKTTEQLIKIVLAGGGVIIDGKSKSTEQLIKIASAGFAGKTKVIIDNVETKTTD